jgi:hypothetical protein
VASDATRGIRRHDAGRIAPQRARATQRSARIDARARAMLSTTRMASRTSLSFSSLALVMLTFSLEGCPSKGKTSSVGDDCVDGASTCKDPHTALVCHGGKQSAVSCKGHHGCRTVGDAAECDQSLAASGDACIETADTSHACTVDHAEVLVCEGGKFRLSQHCRGEKACSVRDDAIDCDVSKGLEGDACIAGSIACSVDGKSVVACVEGRMRVRRTCRGPKACVVDATGKPACDDSVASIGDACETEAKSVCSADAKALLRCERGKFVRKTACYCKGGGCVSECDLY